MNFILAGVGGQGTVLASKLLAKTAMAEGLFVRTAETIGMAQRGGCVVSHVRTGGRINSPMVPLGQADLVLGFEPSEAVRCLPYLRPQGTVVAAVRPIQPVTLTLKGGSYGAQEMIDCLRTRAGRLITVDGEKICRECGSPRVLNVALLGAAAASGCLGLSPEKLEQSLREMVPARFLEMNLKAFRLGGELR